MENPISLNRGVTCILRGYTPILAQLTHGPSDLPYTPLTAPSSSDSRRTGDGAGPGCGSRSASGGHIGSCGQASLCPGSGAGGGHDRFPSRSSKADRRSTAPERRRARSEGEGPIPYGSRTRVAAARRRASFVADYPRRGQASPLQLSCPKGGGHLHRAAGSTRPALPLARDSALRTPRNGPAIGSVSLLTNWKRNENKVRTYNARFPAVPAHGIRRFENGCSSRIASGYRGFHG